MSELTHLLTETAERLFGDLCTKEIIDAAEQGIWPAALWRALEENGLTEATVPEALGGPGLSFGEALTLLRPAGRAAAPVPLAEALLAGHLLGQCGIALPATPVALAIADAGDTLIAVERERLYVAGTVAEIPFARSATHIVAAAQHDRGIAMVLVPVAAVKFEPGLTLADEPLDHVCFDSVEVPAADWGLLPAGLDPFALAALSRAVMMAGALEWVLANTVTYALDRKQFGRAIAEFQAIQQQLAQLAGETAAAIRASDGAIEALGTPHEAFEIAVAKARLAEAAGLAGAIAHQVHGAMGFTYEHPLHQRTRRLWAWREQYGNERHWNAVVGQAIASSGADGIWPLLTRVE